MIFVIDVGNTNIVLGVYDGDGFKHHWRIETYRNRTGDEYGMVIKSLFDYVGLSFSDIKGIIISSVVPPIMHWKECVKSIFMLNRLLLALERRRD